MRRALVVSLFLGTMLFLGYLFHVSREIEKQSHAEECRPADVILVLGAAQYRGKPSPVLQARLEHALLLYRRQLAPFIMTTGGAGRDPDFTEAEVGRAYLIQHGVPSEAIITEEGSTTAQSVDAAAETMHRMNLGTCIVVSDGYHIYRVKRYMEVKHIKIYGSPRPQVAALSKRQETWLYFKQAVGFVLWQAGINI